MPLLLSLTAIALVSAYLFRDSNLWYGDAEAHLNIARRIVDSRTPGYEQIGTVWLPLLHVLLIPFVRIDDWWRSGLAGAIPSTICYLAAAMFLYLAARRTFVSTAAGVTAALVFALNPNMLYLASAPMTEPLFFACETALVAAIVRYAQTGSAMAIFLASLAGLAGTLTRYDGWVLLPFAALAIGISRRRWGPMIVFSMIAGLGPLYWLLHNRWLESNWLAFYNGPYSALAIQGDKPYPGRGDWTLAWRQYREAAVLCAGWGAIVVGIAGWFAGLVKRAWWPILLLSVVPLFYISSVHSGGTPIFVPGLWPNSYYNTRYGMAVLPPIAFGAAALVAVLRRSGYAAFALIAICAVPWFAYPRPENWVVRREAEVNSAARREWTRQSSEILSRVARPGDGIYTSFGDMTGIFRQAGIPLTRTLHEGNGLIWHAARLRPDLFLWQPWIVAQEGSPISLAMKQAKIKGSKVECVKVLIVSGAPPIEIYRNANSLR